MTTLAVPVPFVARKSVPRLARLLLLAAGFVVAGAWMAGLLGEAQGRGILVVALGWTAVLFFGLCAIVIARQLFRSGDLIRVDAHGIFWARWSDQTIPWSAVRDIRLGSIRRQQFLCLDLVDPARYPGRGALGMTAKANRAMNFGDIAITPQGTDRSFEDLTRAIEAFSERAGAG